MVRVRNLVLAIAAATALTSNTVFALGVGEVRLQSALNQPLVADIELLDAKGLGTAEIKPRLASADEFKKLGIDRSYFLSSLKFSTIQRPDGHQVIRVTSSKAVREPYLSFLVEVIWPTGRLVREYTLLFDPPMYAPEAVSQAAPQLPGSKVAPLPPASHPQTAATGGAAATGGNGSGTKAGTSAEAANKEYRVANRDTLWGISERVREVGSVHQNMAAIWDLNQDAFVGGNINRMQTGQVLRLPTADEVTKRTHPEAVGQIAKQTARWQRHNNALPNSESAPTPRQTAVAQAPRSPAAADDSDNLRLVAEEQTPPAATANHTKPKAAPKHNKNEVQALRDELAGTRESLDSSRRESAELKDRLNDLQSQLDKLTRLMQLKDNQLNELQNHLSTDTTAVAPTAPSASGTPESEEATAQAAPTPAPITATPVVPKINLEEGGFEDDLLTFIMENSLLLSAVGGGVLLTSLLALWLVSRRKAKNTAPAQAAPAPKKRSSPTVSRELADDPELDGPATKGAGLSAGSAATDEALAKADIYIAYGHLDEAAHVLKTVVASTPRALEPRLKLLEVYAGMGDTEAFALEEAAVREIGVPERRIRQIKDKFPALGGKKEAPTASGNTMAGLDFDALLDESIHQAEAPAPTNTRPRRAPAPDNAAPQGSGERQSDELAAAMQAAAQRREQESGASSKPSLAKTAAEDPFADFDWDLSETASEAPQTPKKASAKTPPAPPSDFDLSLDTALSAAEANPSTAADDVPTPPKASTKKAAAHEDELIDMAGDEVATKLDLAKAYVEMGDKDGARDILDEVIAEGNDRQKRAARKILGSLA